MSAVDSQSSLAVDAGRPERISQRAAWAAIGFVVLAFACFWPTTQSLLVRWDDYVQRTYTHGYLIVALSLWLIWRDRARLEPMSGYLPGVVPLSIGVLCWIVAWRSGIQIAHQASLPLLILTAVVTGCGWGVARQLLFPILYLYCAVPVWDTFTPVLQGISVFAVRSLLLAGGIPVYFESNRFQLPAGSFEIADGCAGLHFFVVALSISLLYGAIHRDTLRSRVRLVALGVALALLTNWIRIFIILLIGHLTEMQHPLIRGEHYTFGWFMFAGAMIVFFLVVRRWPAPLIASSARTIDAQHTSASGWWAALTVFGVALLWTQLDKNQAADSQPHVLQRRPGGWQAVDAVTAWHPRFEGAASSQHLEYRSQGQTVEAYVATYLSQVQGKEMAGYYNAVLGDLTATEAHVVGIPAQWRGMRARDAQGAEWEVVYTYVVDDKRYSSAFRAGIAYGLGSVFGAPLSSVVVLRSACDGDCERARSALQQFVSAAALP